MASTVGAIVIASIAVPIGAAAFMAPLGRVSPRLRDGAVVGVTGATLAGTLWLVLSLRGRFPLHIDVPLLFGELALSVDVAGLLFAALVAFLWVCCTLASLDYLAEDSKANRYQAVSLVVLGSMIGVAFAGDLIALFLFFEVAGLASYVLIVHKGTVAARSAADKYLTMTLLSGFLLLAGILLTAWVAGGVSLDPSAGASAGLPAVRWLAASLLVVGFGIKAGIVPLHVWLPDAHPVAPSPASALLSGLIIKTGAFGIFRTMAVLFDGTDVQGTLATQAAGQSVGRLLLVLGVVSMLAGVLLALGQHDMKRMLAYSSVSQIGFVIAGLGAALSLAGDPYAAYGLAGGLHHIVNHALYKALLFLGAGAVLIRAGTVDMRELGGLRSRMPLTFGLMVVAAFGIIGLPPLNGFVSKSLVHHAVAAAEPFTLGGIGPFEAGFVVAGGGTFAVLVRLLRSVFGGEPRGKGAAGASEAPRRTLAALALPAAAMMVIGAAPLVVVRHVLVPVALAYGLDPQVLIEYRQYTLEHLGFAGLSVAIGTIVLALDARTGLTARRVPSRLSLDHWYVAGAKEMRRVVHELSVSYEAMLAASSRALRATIHAVLLLHRRASRARRWLGAFVVEGSSLPRYRRAFQRIDSMLEEERERVLQRALQSALASQSEAPACPGRGCDEYVDAVRDIADYLMRRLVADHTSMAAEAVRHDPERAVEATRISLRDVGDRTADTVIATSLELAMRRMYGENVVPDISATVVDILRAEEFPRRLSGAMATFWQPGGPTRVGLDEETASRSVVDAALRRSGAFGIGVLRLIVGALTRERTDWGEAHREEEGVLELRGFVQAVTRNMDVAAVLMVAGLLAIVFVLLA